MKILDVILHRNKYATQTFVVIDRTPKYTYEKKVLNSWAGKKTFLIGEDDGFYNFLYLKHDRFAKAFAGRKFEFKMKDGTIETADGQWWDGRPSEPEYENLIKVGCGTPEKLAKCNVFCSHCFPEKLLNEWLENNEPSNNYYKYDKRHEDYMKHRIISKWEE